MCFLHQLQLILSCWFVPAALHPLSCVMPQISLLRSEPLGAPCSSCVTGTISTGDNYYYCRYSAKCLCAFGCPSKFSCLAQLWRTRGSDLCVPRQLAVQRFAIMHWCSAAAKRRWGLPGGRTKVQHRLLLSSTVENPSPPYITEWA